MSKSELAFLPIDALVRGCYQPRIHFAKQALHELASSIKAQGLIEPLVVRPINSKQYEIIAGERRFRAAQLAGLVELPCLINQYSDQQALAVTLIENIQREDLNVIEEAKGFKRLIDEFAFYHEDIAKMVGKSRSHITNTLRLLQLEGPLQQALIDKTITMGHAKVLVALSSNEQCYFCDQIIKQDWSARRLEKEVRKVKSKALSPSKDRDVKRLESLVSETIATEVEIETQGDGGWLKLKFFNNDTLASVLDRLGVKYE